MTVTVIFNNVWIGGSAFAFSLILLLTGEEKINRKIDIWVVVQEVVEI